MLIMGRRKTNKRKSATKDISVNETLQLKRSQLLSQKQQTISRTKKDYPTWFSFLSPTGKFCAGIMLVLAIVTAYHAFAFKLSINPSYPLDPLDPFATPFNLRNDSLLWINLVNYNCHINKIITNHTVSFVGLGIITLAPATPYLESLESTSFNIPTKGVINYVGHITYGDVEIVIPYYPAFYPKIKLNAYCFCSG